MIAIWMAAALAAGDPTELTPVEWANQLICEQIAQPSLKRRAEGDMRKGEDDDWPYALERLLKGDISEKADNLRMTCEAYWLGIAEGIKRRVELEKARLRKQ